MAAPSSVQNNRVCRVYDSTGNWLYITNHLGVPAVCQNSYASSTPSASGTCQFPSVNLESSNITTDIPCTITTASNMTYANPISDQTIKLTSTLNNYLYGSLNTSNLPYFMIHDTKNNSYNYPRDVMRATNDFEEKLNTGYLSAADVNVANGIIDYQLIFPSIPTTDIPRSLCTIRVPAQGLGSNVYLANDEGDLATCATNVNQLPNGDIYVNGKKHLTPLYADGRCDFLTSGVTTNIPCKSYYKTTSSVASSDPIYIFNNPDSDLVGLQYASVMGSNVQSVNEQIEYNYSNQLQDIINGDPSMIDSKLSKLRSQYKFKYTPVVRPATMTPIVHMSRIEMISIIVSIVLAIVLYLGSRRVF